jgi:hypothetical protein
MSNLSYAQVAQSVEHVLGKDEVGGSIPLLGFAWSRVSGTKFC